MNYNKQCKNFLNIRAQLATKATQVQKDRETTKMVDSTRKGTTFEGESRETNEEYMKN